MTRSNDIARGLEWLDRIDWRVVFVAALALHLAAQALRSLSYTRTENLRVGVTLAEKGYLGDPFILPTGPTAHVSPVYPVVVAAVQSLTHDEDRTVAILGLIGAIVSAGNVAMLLPLARRMRLPPSAGPLAALLWVAPLFAWIELGAEHETTFTTAAVLATLLVVFSMLARAQLAGPEGAMLGAVTGVAAHFSPLLLPMVVGAMTLGGLARWRTLRLRPTFVVAFAAALIVVVAPYTIRNRAVMGSTFFIRDNLGLELAVSNADDAKPTAEANVEPGSAMERHPFISRDAARRMRAMGEVAYNKSRMREAQAWIRTHPSGFLRLTAQRAGYLLAPYSRRPYQRAIATMLTIGLLAGLVVLWRAGERVTVAAVVGALAGYQFIYLFVQHDVRYVYSMMWIESLVAAAVPARLFGRARGRVAVGGGPRLPEANAP
jgi:hypothetical protein